MLPYIIYNCFYYNDAFSKLVHTHAKKKNYKAQNINILIFDLRLQYSSFDLFKLWIKEKEVNIIYIHNNVV